MRVVIQENYDKMCKWAAGYIAARINAHGGERPFVLGLPTGSSPLGVYAAGGAFFAAGSLRPEQKRLPCRFAARKSLATRS